MSKRASEVKAESVEGKASATKKLKSQGSAAVAPVSASAGASASPAPASASASASASGSASGPDSSSAMNPDDKTPNNLIASFCFHNNKGGVGKSSLSFQVIAALAEEYPNVNVLAVDLCPQSNLTQLLLGGDITGVDLTAKYSDKRNAYGVPPTIAGFTGLFGSASAAPGAADLGEYVVALQDVNPKFRDWDMKRNNIWLVPGDPYLDLTIQPLTQHIGSLIGSLGQDSNWKLVILMLRRAINRFVRGQKSHWIVVIDTNPSFNLYTQIAVAAATDLVIPLNADVSSKVGVQTLFALIWGERVGGIPQVYLRSQWKNIVFSALVKENGLQLPRINQFVKNHSKAYKKEAGAYQAMTDNAAAVLFDLYQKDKEGKVAQLPAVVSGTGASDHRIFAKPVSEIGKIAEFHNEFISTIMDWTSTGVLSAYTGRPIITMRASRFYMNENKKKTTPQAQSTQFAAYAEALRDLIARLMRGKQDRLPGPAQLDVPPTPVNSEDNDDDLNILELLALYPQLGRPPAEPEGWELKDINKITLNQFLAPPQKSKPRPPPGSLGSDRDLSAAEYQAHTDRLEAVLRRHNLEGRPDKYIRSNGACLFDSVADQYYVVTGSHQIEVWPEERIALSVGLRNMVSQYFLDFADTKLPNGVTIAQHFASPGEFKQYCRDLKLETTWGECVCIQALANVLRRQILVYTSWHNHDPAYYDRNVVEFAPDSGAPPGSRPLRISNWADRHFNSLCFRPVSASQAPPAPASGSAALASASGSGSGSVGSIIKKG